MGSQIIPDDQVQLDSIPDDAVIPDSAAAIDQPQFQGTGNQLVDSFLMAGNEAKRGFFKGGAAAVTPLSMLLKLGQVPDQFNLPEQSRQLYDKYAGDVPESNINPVAKFIYEGIGSTPGQVAAWEQTGAPLLKAGGAAFGAGKNLLGKLMESKAAPLEAQKVALNSHLETTKVLNDIQSTSIAADMNANMAAKKISTGEQIKDISGNIKTAADEASRNARSSVMNYWNELKTNFGRDYAAAGKGAKITPSQELDALTRGAADSGIYSKIESGSPLNPAEKKIMSLINNAQDRASSELNVARPLSHFDQEINSLASEHGGDHTVTAVRKSVADILDEFKVVRSKYKQPYQLKNEMFKIFQPFNKSGSFDTTSGTNLLNRAFNGKASPDEMRLVEELTKRDPELFSQLKSLKTTKDSLVSGLQQAQESHAKNLTSLMQDSQKATMDALVEHKNSSDLLDSLITKAKASDAKKVLISDLLLHGARGAATTAGVGAVFGAGKSLYDILNRH
ncbi:hypothetical protein KW791_00570 [Candidatus Parcubacteria bacterium]|nr:hypothetical protein [Candidatus Parcubacteria bacterium]